MSNAGLPEADTPVQDNAVPGLGRQGLCLLFLGGLIVGAFIIGIQVLAVLYALLFPPEVPRPDRTEETAYSHQGVGLDRWQYQLNANACDAINFYQQITENCDLVTTACTSSTEILPEFAPRQTLAICSGLVTYGPFTMSWESRIQSGEDGLRTTVLMLTRELLWLTRE